MDNKNKITEAIKFLSNNYFDKKVNNNIIMDMQNNIEFSKTVTYEYCSYKKSKFKNICFSKSQFINVALTGSTFENVKFSNSILTGSSLANCSFYNVEFLGDKTIYESNNISLSNFEKCSINSINFFRTGSLNAYFHDCKLNNVIFSGSTLEGTEFSNCHFKNVDLGNVNLDYTIFFDNYYENVIFPFYQVPYIIGIAHFLRSDNENIKIRVGEKLIKCNEYLNLIEKLKLYYLDKNEFFPICNLNIIDKNFSEAKDNIMNGIKIALEFNDFRMVNNFCQLAKFHGLIDENIKKDILLELDSFINSDIIPESQLNYYLNYISKIKALLNKGSKDSVTLNYVIKTETNKDDKEGIVDINVLLNSLNSELSCLNNIEGYQVTVSNYSPFEIAIHIISAVGSLATVASLVWSIVTSDGKNKNSLNNKTYIKELGTQYVDERIERAKYELLNVHANISKKKLNAHITAVMQSLKTDIEDFYSKNVMIFEIKKDKK